MPRQTRTEPLGGKSIHTLIVEEPDNKLLISIVRLTLEQMDCFVEKTPSSPFYQEYGGKITFQICRKAAEENADLLTDLLLKTKDPVEKSLIIEALPYSEDERFVSTIANYIDDFSPFVRQAAITGLHSYAELSEELAENTIFPVLEKRLEIEDSVPLKKALQEALNCNKFDFK